MQVVNTGMDEQPVWLTLGKGEEANPMASETLTLLTYLRPKLDPDALLGLPGEIATRLSEATGADEAAILLSTLTMLGSAAGSEPHISYWGAEHPARLIGGHRRKDCHGPEGDGGQRGTTPVRSGRPALGQAHRRRREEPRGADRQGG